MYTPENNSKVDIYAGTSHTFIYIEDHVILSTIWILREKKYENEIPTVPLCTVQCLYILKQTAVIEGVPNNRVGHH